MRGESVFDCVSYLGRGRDIKMRNWRQPGTQARELLTIQDFIRDPGPDPLDELIIDEMAHNVIEPEEPLNDHDNDPQGAANL